MSHRPWVLNRLPHMLLRLYPRPWRERYGEEFLALIQAQPFTVRQGWNIVACAFVEQFRSVPRSTSLALLRYATFTTASAFALERVALGWCHVEANWLAKTSWKLRPYAVLLDVGAVVFPMIASVPVTDRYRGALKSTVTNALLTSWILTAITMPLAFAVRPEWPTFVPMGGLSDWRALSLWNLAMATVVVVFDRFGIRSPIQRARPPQPTSVLGLH